ncbi:MAG TPA: group 1 truncated hemoglobin [Pyrinomonadaceae bacterium]|nr:group 1 truncated hemoglobin [Pyrinomonadaceae bacterium]
MYERLGGEAGLTRIVGDFLNQFFKHDRIQNPFVTRRHDAAFHPELTRQWVAFVTQSTGGPRKYKGRTMHSSHAGLRISDTDFDTTIELMDESLSRAGVAPGDREQLLTIMRAQRVNIVEKPDVTGG